MERTILHIAIDSFPIQAERLRRPKLQGRPLVLIPGGSQRPRVILTSREAREAGILPGTPLVHARRLCRDLVALPLDRDFYGGIGESIFERLAPLAPVVEPGGGAGVGAGSGRFFLDLTGVDRSYPEARDRAVRAGRDVEEFFRLHPTLGVAGNKLVSRVAAQVVAPDGDLLDVSSGSEASFLAPLPIDLLPAAHGADTAARLDLLNVRLVRQLQALSLAQLARALGRDGSLLWNQARGLDPTPVRAPETRPRVVAEETLARETNDSRVLSAHAARLGAELSAELRARGEGARGMALGVEYADGFEGAAKRTFVAPLRGSAAIAAAVAELLERAVKRRVRVRRLRLSAWGIVAEGKQLTLWDEGGDAPNEGGHGPDAGGSPSPGRAFLASSLESTIDRARERFGTEALVPAAWILHGLTVRPSARP
jgi:DNA polymerase-4